MARSPRLELFALRRRSATERAADRGFQHLAVALAGAVGFLVFAILLFLAFDFLWAEHEHASGDDPKHRVLGIILIDTLIFQCKLQACIKCCLIGLSQDAVFVYRKWYISGLLPWSCPAFLRCLLEPS